MWGIRHGAQGQLDRASKSMLENEFGTKNEEDVVRKILEQGDVQEQKVCDLPHNFCCDRGR